MTLLYVLFLTHASASAKTMILGKRCGQEPVNNNNNISYPVVVVYYFIIFLLIIYCSMFFDEEEKNKNCLSIN